MRYVTLLLTFIAGFTDTTTFVAADKLFSAHVTGNFIVLAYDLIRGADRSAYIKLLAVPVFVLAAMLAAWHDRKHRPVRLLRLEGCLLLVAAGLSLVWKPVFPAAMLVVAAMAIQNSFGRLYPELTWSTTTVMTGNTTTAAVSFIQGFTARPRDARKLALSRQILIMAGVFLVGCICGGLLASRFGLAVIALPGILALLVGTLVARNNMQSQRS
jgi:uncharacterized membrane protein YoaK (UPF0700 family)